MAPFRNRDRANRSGRGQVEHNVLEGLPINQYREVEITIGNNSTENKQVDKDAWPELPMPRESHQLPEHSQQLLRAARAGKVFKPPPPPEEDIEKDEEDDHKEVPQGFTIKKWVKVARHLEEPEPEYLAKRRKGLPSQYAVGQITAPPSVMRETKVKKTDAEGNVVVYKALVPEGQAVEGEVQGTDAVVEAAPVAAAPGTVVEGVGVVNAEGVVVANDAMTPGRRKPPMAKKRKRHGPGRGKRRAVIAGREAGAQPLDAGAGLLSAPHLKQEGSVEPSEGGDTPMPDAGDDDEGSGEEGSDEEDREEGTHSPSLVETDSAAPGNPPTQPVMQSSVEPQTEDTLMTDAAPAVPAAPAEGMPAVSSEPVIPTVISADINTLPEPKPEPEQKAASSPKPKRDVSSSPEMPLSTISHSRQNSLNQVPTMASLDASAVGPSQGTVQATAQELTQAPVTIEASIETVGPTPIVAPTELPAPKVETISPPVPTESEVQPKGTETPSNVQDQTPKEVQSQVYEQELAKVPADPVPEVPVQAEVPEEVAQKPLIEQNPEAPVKESVGAPVDAPADAPAEVTTTKPEPESKAAPATTETSNEAPAADNSEPDLLGSLESHLEKERETMETAENP